MSLPNHTYQYARLPQKVAFFPAVPSQPRRPRSPPQQKSVPPARKHALIQA
ncbi:hypothetical protein KNP414_05883 [Paenibacillus mucilaginosus KNP414]|uniref:Uncharacterized protein n=1 Tax=Paenibacillus mucilaginosus (strain KNP414) TaxID=1036673 RepID=F8F9S8_PAEMK|nr:hypothetical protein KNP414_05883 [Paenibacillus mucilaginosus KNP414]